jgi:hypothetical protein
MTLPGASGANDKPIHIEQPIKNEERGREEQVLNNQSRLEYLPVRLLKPKKHLNPSKKGIQLPVVSNPDKKKEGRKEGRKERMKRKEGRTGYKKLKLD